MPDELKEKINQAIRKKMTIIVGTSTGSCRLFQDYLQSKNYKKVRVGHAKSIRDNAGNWQTKQYGLNVMEKAGSLPKT